MSNVVGGFNPKINGYIGKMHENNEITKAHVGENAFQPQYVKEIVRGPVGM